MNHINLSFFVTTAQVVMIGEATFMMFGYVAKKMLLVFILQLTGLIIIMSRNSMICGIV